MKRLITQKDLDANPILKELGIKLGWAVSVTKDEVSLGKSNDNEQSESNEGDDTGGGNPPPDKNKPDKP